MIFNFGFDNEIEECIIEIKIGNQVQRQRVQGLVEMIQMQFTQMLQEVVRSDQPIRIKLIKEESIWNQYSQQFKKLENSIQFANKKYMQIFPDEFKEV
ncbi:MAG: hypothetical protein MSS80_07970 [Mollicutes bacterium]|nr:hypothetical protein [Mollicutes bacterium]